MNKTWNVLGIIMAWLLSIVLVLMLIATPIVFSALSLLNADTITKVVSGALTAGADSQPSAESWQVTRLSNTTAETPSADAGKNVLEGLFGDQLTQEQMDKILSSKLVKDFVKTYTDDLVDAFADGGKGPQLNAEKVKSIVNDHIDEIVDILQEVVPECAQMDRAELKANIQKAVEEGAEQIIQSLPKPEDIRQEIAQENPGLETALKILAKKDTIKLAIIGVIILISGLIFLCRLPGFLGFRWLAVDLFVGAGFGAFFSVGLVASSAALGEIAKEAGEQTAGLIGTLLSVFTTGMFVRTGVMLVAGGLLLAAYIVIKRKRAEKMQPAEVLPEALAEKTNEV